jgi:disulfide oxidoreductase YuzD
MLNKDDKKVQVFIKQCADFCKSNGLKTQKEVYDWLVADLTKTYKGRAPKWKIESVAEDITESVCLELNIHQKGIRK